MTFGDFLNVLFNGGATKLRNIKALLSSVKECILPIASTNFKILSVLEIIFNCYQKAVIGHTLIETILKKAGGFTALHGVLLFFIRIAILQRIKTYHSFLLCYTSWLSV